MPVQQDTSTTPLLPTLLEEKQLVAPANKRVVHLTSVHYPFDVRIFHKECKTLARYGYEVILIAPYSKSEELEGVQLQRVKVPANRVERMIITTWRIYSKALKLRADIYHFHDPELLPVGLLLKLMGKRVIYDVHENVEDDILSKAWIAKPLRSLISKLVGAVESRFSKAFDAVIAATPPIAKKFPVKRTIVVQNFPIIEELVAPDGKNYRDRPFVVLYIGSITIVRGAVEMVNALNLLPKQLAVKLLLVGDIYPESLKKELLSNVGENQLEFLGFQGRDKLSEIFGKARVGLVLFHPVPNYIDSQPNKLFEYMSAGIPVIASDFRGWRNIIVDITRSGIIVDPLNVADIAKAITWICENPSEAEEMGKRGREAISSYYNWDTQTPVLLDLYGKILS